MGKILVGQTNPKAVDVEGFTVAPRVVTEKVSKVLSAEEKADLVERVMLLPREQIVPELRRHGLNEIADVTEVQMRRESEAVARHRRRDEILAMPVDEQLPLLLAEGYEDEARELSERLAAEQKGEVGEGSGEENAGTEAPADGTVSELNEEGAGTVEEAPDNAAEQPEKKKGGRPKKSETK